MKNYKVKGFLNGIFAAISYGTNPLFALPMYTAGLSTGSVLFYRYLFASLIYGLWLKIFKKTSLKLTVKEFLCLFLLAILFVLSSITLFESFKYIDSGIACTILFVYPVIVTAISALLFKEKITPVVIFSMFLTSAGIILLYGGKNTNLNTKGVILIMLSAFLYASYMVLVKNLKPIKHIKYNKLSFYVMLFCLMILVFNSKFCTTIEPINDWKTLLCATALGIFPTIVSLETINIAIRLIGSTTTAILGALEPLTAIFFGVLLFGEILTFKIIIGIMLILAGVILIISKDAAKQY